MGNYIAVYIAIINITGIIVCVYDKRAAIKKRRRVSERTLFAISLFGGALGVYIAMLAVRHKTKRWYFMVFLPCIIIGWAALIIYLVLV